MCALLRYSAGGLAALLASAYIAVSAESGTSAFRPMVMEPEGTAQTVVNRAGKGDRQMTVRDARGPAAQPESIRNRPAVTAREPKILEGCDPAFSPSMASAKSNFANRCLV